MLVTLPDAVLTKELEGPSCPLLVSDRAGKGGMLSVGDCVTGSRFEAGPVKLLVGAGAF